jgi:hypothetical protein
MINKADFRSFRLYDYQEITTATSHFARKALRFLCLHPSRSLHDGLRTRKELRERDLSLQYLQLLFTISYCFHGLISTHKRKELDERYVWDVQSSLDDRRQSRVPTPANADCSGTQLSLS